MKNSKLRSARGAERTAKGLAGYLHAVVGRAPDAGRLVKQCKVELALQIVTATMQSSTIQSIICNPDNAGSSQETKGSRHVVPALVCSSQLG